MSSGFKTSSSSDSSTSSLLPPPPPANKKIHSLEEGEFKDYSLQQLQRVCLISQIKAAKAQENAAKEMLKYFSSRNQTVTSALVCGSVQDPFLLDSLDFA